MDNQFFLPPEAESIGGTKQSFAPARYVALRPTTLFKYPDYALFHAKPCFAFLVLSALLTYKCAIKQQERRR
jgi:hypothetical protein